MSAGKSTINSVLKIGATAAALTNMGNIKTYPQLGGSPENLEVTDMLDTMQRFVLGVQSVEQMQFTMNYDKTEYEALVANSYTDLVYQLEFGNAGADGIFHWSGQHSIFINDGAVNGIREMTLVVAPSTAVTLGAAT